MAAECLLALGTASVLAVLHTICSRTRAFWKIRIYGPWTFQRRREALMPTQIKARTYGLLFALVGVFAATGGNFRTR